MNILGVDPGTRTSGVVRLGDDRKVLFTDAAVDNLDVRAMCETGDLVVIEACRLYMGVGVETELTIRWSGRFCECAFQSGIETLWVYPSERRQHWGVKRDAEQRVALQDFYGGVTIAKGTKKAPGPLYGVCSHAWSALALALMGYEAIEKRRGR